MHKLAKTAVLIYFSIAGSQAHIITMQVFDQVGASMKVLQRAEDEASLVLQRSGDLQIEWLNCNAALEACLGELRSNELVLLLRAEASGKYAEGGQAIVDSAHTGKYASIYYNWVLREAQIGNFDPARLVGYVIAHEVGHLLGLPHSRGGVMAAQWKLRELQLVDMGWLRFEESEYRQMRTEIATRLQISTQANLPSGPSITEPVSFCQH